MSAATLQRAVGEMEQIHDAATLMRWDPLVPTPAAVIQLLRKMLHEGWPPTVLGR